MKRRLALAALAMALASCAPEPPGRTLLLITVDTLRADHVGAWGNPEGTSPELDRLARGAAQFRQCLSVSSWTMPAMGTLGTGLPPSEHGLLYWHMPLADVPETLSEVLAQGGIRSAFFGNPIPRLEGLDRGFDTWQTFEGNDHAAVVAATRWLGKSGGDRFVWVHLLGPHAPYDPRPADLRTRPGVSAEALSYEGEVRTVDREVRTLLRAVGPEAAVIVTADHGETLDERRTMQFDHGKRLYEELLRVPGLLRFPGAAPELVSRPVILADFPVTICDWFGEAPPAGAYGESLAPLVRGDRSAPRREVTFASVVEDEPPAHRDRRWTARGERWKAVYNVDKDRWDLFDLALDPKERIDVSAEHPAELEYLRRELEDWRADHAFPDLPFDRRFTPAELERLQSLGYLGGADR
ncbi:MAG: sulfatase-like hydrolase/transferase [Gemmatimonadetes bacterium]|nr:sulfatase-like hydrolase/transferase [Gemmatimonadota bacterium]